MSVQIWWKERLAARNPFSGEAVAGADYKVPRGHVGHWPTSVARQSLLRDYRVWHDTLYLAPYKETGYYLDNPDRMPAMADSQEFFSIMGPFLYVAGKKLQTRNYTVPIKTRHDGGWVVLKKGKNFIRLCGWEAHCAKFELLTGLKVHDNVLYFNPELGKVINDAIDAVEDKVEQNREILTRGMLRD